MIFYVDTETIQIPAWVGDVTTVIMVLLVIWVFWSILKSGHIKN